MPTIWKILQRIKIFTIFSAYFEKMVNFRKISGDFKKIENENLMYDDTLRKLRDFQEMLKKFGRFNPITWSIMR